MTWFDFAKKIFIREKLSINNKKFKIIPISSKDYPVLAKRPANSVLDLKKIKSSFSL
jgi:dTDP-4-dehydrorhamnose reductase